MNKVLTISSKVSFAVFWIFAGLSIAAWLHKHTLFSTVTVIALLGLTLGLWTRAERNGVIHAPSCSDRNPDTETQPQI